MLSPLRRAGGRHPIPSVRMDIGVQGGDTLSVWRGPAGGRRVVTRGPGGDTGRTGGMTPFIIKEFQGSVAPRCHEQTPMVLITHTKVVLTWRILLIRLPKM